MRHPASVTCDKCGKPIDSEKPWTAANVAVPDDIAEDIRDAWSKDQVQVTVLGLQLPIQTPTHMVLDICRACEDPDMRPLVALKVQQMLAERRTGAQQPNAKPRFRGH
jgi:hypothetical protein